MPRYFKTKDHYKYTDSEGITTEHLGYGVVSDASTGYKNEEHPFGYSRLKRTSSYEIPNVYVNKGKPETELFTHVPENIKVTHLFADKRVRPHMMTMMGLLKNDYPNAEITHDASLSIFSSRLTRHALNRGLVTRNPENRNANPNGSHHDTTPVQEGNMATIYNHVTNGSNESKITEIAPEDVAKGRQTVRNMIRPGSAPKERKQTPKVESEQLKLPGI